MAQEQNIPQGDFRKRIARGENPYAAAARPMEGGSLTIRPGFITPQFDELRGFISANVLPDFEQQLTNLQTSSQKDIPVAVGEYTSLDVDSMPNFSGMVESGALALTMHQRNGASNRVIFRPFRLEKYMSVDVSTDFGYEERDGGAYISLSTHGRGYPYREQMVISSSSRIFSGNGRVAIIHEYDVNQEGNAPATEIELRFYDDSEDKSRLPDHRIAAYRRNGDKFTLCEDGFWLKGVREMGVQLPQEATFDADKGELVLGIPTQAGNTETMEEKRITFPNNLSPNKYLEAVKNGTVDDTVLGGFNVV